jgi:chromate transporter
MEGSRIKHLFEVFIVALRLGLTSFGGPIAHLGYFHQEYVRRRKWMDEQGYADLVALCQFLPGPASSQVGIGVGVMRQGILGGIVAWLGFTLPSVIVLILFALLLQSFDLGTAGFIHGLKIVAVAIVAHAVLGMGQKLAPDKPRATIAILTAIIVLIWPTTFIQVLLILAFGLIGYMLFKQVDSSERVPINISIKTSTAIFSLSLFFALLIFLPILRYFTSHELIALFDSFYRAGSLVFGGGHVVLPLLERETVPTGLISAEAFLVGYGATQAVPGPLFTFASYLGMVMAGWSGAVVATIAIFLPAFLLVLGVLPFWNRLRSMPAMQGALTGINAAVVGLLFAALYNPIWTSSILNVYDFALAAILFGLLVFWKAAPWMIVIVGIIGGTLLSML